MCKALFVIILFALLSPAQMIQAHSRSAADCDRLIALMDGAGVHPKGYERALVNLLRDLAAKNVLKVSDLKSFEGSSFDPVALETAAARIPSITFRSKFIGVLKELSRLKAKGAIVDVAKISELMSELAEKISTKGVERVESAKKTAKVFFPPVPLKTVIGQVPVLETFNTRENHSLYVAKDVEFFLFHTGTGAKTPLGPSVSSPIFYETQAGEVFLAFNTKEHIKVVNTMTGAEVASFELAEHFLPYSKVQSLPALIPKLFEGPTGNLTLMVNLGMVLFVRDLAEKQTSIRHTPFANWVSLQVAAGRVWSGYMMSNGGHLHMHFAGERQGPVLESLLPESRHVSERPAQPLFFRKRNGNPVVAAFDGKDIFIHDVELKTKTALKAHVATHELADTLAEGPNGQLYYLSHQRNDKGSAVLVFEVGKPQNTVELKGFPPYAISSRFLHLKNGETYLFVFNPTPAFNEVPFLFVIDWRTKARLKVPLNLGGKPIFHGAFEGPEGDVYAHFKTANGVELVQLRGAFKP